MRFSPPQQRIYRAVEGAVRNATHAHPKWKIDARLASSIAKRATGTLSAQWVEVLAAKSNRPSEGVAESTANSGAGSRISPANVRGRGKVSVASRPSPFRLLWKELSIAAGTAKREGRQERAEALIDVLRCVDALRKEYEETVGTPSGKGSGL